MLNLVSYHFYINFTENKTTLRQYFSIFFCLCLPLLVVGQARIPYEFRHLTISEGLPDNTVYFSMQDSRGYIWFCTANGVSRYDGRRFQNFTISDGLADNEILKTTEDSKGRIWFHTLNGRLSYFDTKTEKIVSYRTSAVLKKAGGETYLTSIIEGADGSVWILIDRFSLKRLMPNGEVRRYNPEKKRFIGVFKDTQNRIFLAGDTFRLFDAQRDTFVDWVALPSKIKEQKRGRWGEKKGVLWLEFSKDIFEFSNGTFRTIISKDIIQNQFIRSISADSLGNFWLGITNGFYRFDMNHKKPVRFFPTKSHVSHVITDNEGNGWVCTLGEGVFFLPRNYDNITVMNKVQGLESEEVTALSQNTKGDIVIATYPNVLQFWDKKTAKIYRKLKINGMWDVRVKRLLFPNDRNFWVLTDNYRINFFPDFSKKPTPQYDSRQAKINEFLSLEGQIPDKNKQYDGDFDILGFLNSTSAFKNIYFAKNGRIYITSNIISELTPLPNNRVRSHLYCKNSNARLYAVAEDAHGVMWFGGTQGICFLKPNDDDVVFLKDNFETSVNDIVPLPDDYLLCSTTGNGVFLLKNGKILKNWQEKDGLSSNSCNRLLKFDNQTVFVATAKGVTRLTFDPIDPTRMYPIIYGGIDAKPSLYINDLFFDGEKLYIASNEGLYSFKINDLKIQRNIPIVCLTQPMAYLAKPDTVLPLRYGWFYQEKEIKFNFRAIAFCNGEVMHFRYRLFRNGALEKRDSIVLREDFTLPLVSLNSGSYILEVEASRGDGIWSKPLGVRFEAPAAIYRKPIALFFYWLIVSWFSFEFFRWRNRQRSYRQLHDLTQKEERLAIERRQLEWEQEAIRARIDPHFVFNALNGILTFVYKRDIDSIKIQLPRLARFIRTSLNLGREDFISIEQEAQYLNDYLALEKSRFEEKFTFSVKITEGVDAQQKMLPPLLLQIFVENAIKHGVSSLPKGKMGVIAIVFEKTGDHTICCTITDNGIGLPNFLREKKDNSGHQSLGLNLVKRRISLLNKIYKHKYTLNISDNGERTKVVLTVES